MSNVTCSKCGKRIKRKIASKKDSDWKKIRKDDEQKWLCVNCNPETDKSW